MIKNKTFLFCSVPDELEEELDEKDIFKCFVFSDLYALKHKLATIRVVNIT